jgi:hypothetical protein
MFCHECVEVVMLHRGCLQGHKDNSHDGLIRGWGILEERSIGRVRRRGE